MIKDVKTLDGALEELVKLKQQSTWRTKAKQGWCLKFKLFGIPLTVSLDP